MEHLHGEISLLWCLQCRNPHLVIACRCRTSWGGFWIVSTWISVRQKKSHPEESKVTALPARPLPPSVRIKDSRQTNFPFVPFLFLQGRSHRAAHYFTNPFVVHKNQTHSPVCNTPVRHWCSLQDYPNLVVPKYSTNKAPRLSKLFSIYAY